MWRFGILICASCAALIKTPGTATSAPDGSMGRGPEAPPRVIKNVSLPLPDAPTDPWSAVKGDQPILFDAALGRTTRFTVPADKRPCTAARDHCLPSLAWMWVHEGESGPVKTAIAVVLTSEGPAQPANARGNANSDNFIAYRTVPATKTNLVPGALVASHPLAIPKDPENAWERWALGTVERVDWDLGLVWFERSKEPHFITSLRVAVLAYPKGGKVTIVGDKKRDELAVKAADVILPAD
jgi:hypothetical protein